MIFSNFFKRNIRTFGLTAVFFLILASANAQTWSAQAIGGSLTADKCAATCMDASGNVYVAGTINSGTSTFGSGSFASAGLFDGIVLKYNSAGVFQWGYRFGSTLNDNALAIATDGTNVYVAGTYSGSVTIGSSSLTSAGGADGVVMSLNASTGAANWGTSFGGASAENVFGLTIDPSSNIYVTGSFFSAPATFGSFPLTPNGGSNSDMFVAKLNSLGAIQWASNGGSTGNDDPVGGSVSYVPSLTELVVVGGTNGGGTCTYGSVSFAASTGAGNDIILLEVNATTGAFISGTAAGGNGSSNEDALASCYDSFTGNVMLSGYFNSPSFTLGSTTLTNATGAGGVDDMFYTSYNPSTNAFVWAKSAGGSGAGSDRARGICSNTTGGIILGGLISGASTCTFPSTGTIQITNARANGGDPFLAQVDASTGNAIWAKIGAADPATGTDNAINAVTCAASGTIWGAGLATTNLTFSPLGALTSTGGVDIFAVKLVAPPPLTATQSQVNLTCNGVCTGSATVVAAGGTSPYTYSWSPSGGSGATASSLCATNYTVTITDAASASITKTFTVTQPSAITSSVSTSTNVSCFGGSNGAATISASGGTGTLTYNWTPGNPTGDGTVSVTGLAAGTWTCTITDAASCTHSQTVTITQPTATVSGTTVVTNVACFGGSNGTINLTPSGGSGGFTFNWLPSGPTTEDRTGLTAGTYTVQITDVNGCTGTVNATVTQPTSPVSGTTVVT
ncbi:MAG: type sorting protein, partial [Bacteroidetes bacterium]|nr:type sorting protein [Bacteroidota bacterium]